MLWGVENLRPFGRNPQLLGRALVFWVSLCYWRHCQHISGLVQKRDTESIISCLEHIVPLPRFLQDFMAIEIGQRAAKEFNDWKMRHLSQVPTKVFLRGERAWQVPDIYGSASVSPTRSQSVSVSAYLSLVERCVRSSQDNCWKGW